MTLSGRFRGCHCNRLLLYLDKLASLSSSEWHPFTISSAPEQAGYFTLHIRGVGQWTNRLYSYFEEEYRKQQSGNEEEQSGFDRLRGFVFHVRISRHFYPRDTHFLCRTMMRKYTTVKKNISMYNRHRVVDRDPSNPDFQTISSMYQVHT